MKTVTIKSTKPGSLGIRIYQKIRAGWKIVKAPKKRFWNGWIVTLIKE